MHNMWQLCRGWATTMFSQVRHAGGTRGLKVHKSIVYMGQVPCELRTNAQASIRLAGALNNALVVA